MTPKITRYKLLPNQGKFLFGTPDDKINQASEKGETYIDVASYIGGVGCLPADAEYLSPTGWKPLSALTQNDILAVYNPDGTIKFEHPIKVHKYKADVWYDFDTRFVKQRLCPAHNIVYFNDRGSQQDLPQKTTCAEYVSNGCNGHYKIKNTFKANGIVESGLSEINLRLYVAYQADGYDYQKVHKNKISQYSVGFHLKKSHKVARLIDLLKAAGARYKVIQRKNGIKAGYYDIFFKADFPLDKNFPCEWYGLSDKELAIICDEVKYWDCGHKILKSGKSGSYTYYTNSKANRDFIQFACASQGYCTTTYERKRNITIHQSGKEYKYPEKMEYSVSWTHGKTIALGKPKSITRAKGGEAKYCPQTTTGMWLARYKNYIFVTGNS